MSTTTLALIALGGVWLLMVLLANPAGEFPLNDDWSYGRAVQNLIVHGRLEFTGFTSMPLIVQVLWGALFSLPFGFSFTGLRLSTIFLGLVGIFTTFELLKEVTANRTIALFAAAVIAVNPVYFLLSLTFMTDVPFFAASMLSFLFLMRALRTENRVDLIAGFGLAGAAILIRQLGVIIPLSFAVAYFVKHGVSRKAFQNALVPNVTLVSLLLAYPIVLRRTIGLPALYDRSFEPILESASLGLPQVPLILTERFFVEWIYLGLFLLPFLILVSTTAWQRMSSQGRGISALIGSGLSAVVMSMLLWRGQIMPLIGNILVDLGLGPALLRDTYLLRLPHLPTAPKEFWLMITAAGVIGGLLLIHRLLDVVPGTVNRLNPGSETEKLWTILLFSALLLYSVLIAITGFLDRYLIFPVPLLISLIAKPRSFIHLQLPPVSLLPAAAVVLLFGIFGLAGTHDYLAWNRARWQALNDLIERDQVSYKSIDGGFEFNGWYAYDPKYRQHPPQSWWWVDQDDYVISFGAMPGYVEVRRYTYERWIPFGQGNIFVLHRAKKLESGTF